MARLVCALFLFTSFAGPLAGEQPTINGKPDFSGTWRSESGDSATFVIKQDEDTISIRDAASSGKPDTDMRCGVRGKECSGRVDGNEADLVFYFNGPMLVQMTTKGKNVTKVRRTLSADGKKITMEIMPFVPQGKTETITLVRAEDNPNTSASRQ